MLSLSKVFKISRPRFWFYTFGTFLIGRLAGLNPSIASLQDYQVRSQAMVDFQRWYILLLLLCIDYFLIGVNILIYGVNDLADEDTDALNDKKGDYEHHLKTQERTGLSKRIFWITLLEGGTVTLGLTYLLRATNSQLRWTVPLVMGALWLSSIFYSMKPVRAKAYPFVDGLFNILYIIPAMAGWLITSHTWQGFGWLGFVAGWLWAMAMHAYSAIPDIQPDADAGLTTTAVLLGKKGTLSYCAGLWLVAAILGAVQGGGVFAVLGIPYLVMIALSWNGSVDKLYRLFPWINATVGFLLFWGIVLV